MKSNYSILGGLASIVIGLLVMLHPAEAINTVLWIIGVLLLVVGAMQLISFFTVQKQVGLSWETFPLGGILGVLFGLLLVITPETFASFFIKLVGVALIVLAIGQIALLRRTRKTLPELPVTGYIFPVLMGLSGFVFFIYSLDTATWLTIFAGAWVMAYGISEITAWFVIRHYRSKSGSSNQ